MRFDKLTTKFQQALADAQSAALAHDAGFIEPQHLLLALLAQDDGGAATLLQRAGVNVASLRKALEAAVARLPKVEGQGGEISVSRELGSLLNLTDKEAAKRGDQYIASELFLLAAARDKGDTGRLLKQHGADAAAIVSRTSFAWASSAVNGRPSRSDAASASLAISTSTGPTSARSLLGPNASISANDDGSNTAGIRRRRWPRRSPAFAGPPFG